MNELEAMAQRFCEAVVRQQEEPLLAFLRRKRRYAGIAATSALPRMTMCAPTAPIPGAGRAKWSA